MTFLFTPEEALPCAEALLQHLRATGAHCLVEQAALRDAPYRTTLHARVAGQLNLYEVQGAIEVHNQLAHFSQWLFAARADVQLFVVGNHDAATTAELNRQLKKTGIGLMLRLPSGEFEEVHAARNPAFVVSPDPVLRIGARRNDVLACIAKFNDGAHKDGLRDLCEIVEGETERVLDIGSRRGVINLTLSNIHAKDWSDQINCLASKNIMNGGRDALIDSKLKDDLHSFRGARNLVDHPARTLSQDRRRRQQFVERMMMGSRLVAELSTVRRRLR